jgi:esterase/lipase superfamily enzyme
MKTTARWRSERMQRDTTLVRWGVMGTPVLLFPTAGGDAEEIERFHMIGVLSPLIEANKIKVYSCDSVAGKAMITQEGTPQHRMWLLNQFHQYVRHEVVPAIRTDCQSADIGVMAAGASIGAFHSVAMVCRFPDVFTHALACSGTYDLRRFISKNKNEHWTDDFWRCSPVHFMSHLGGPHLEKLRTRFILMPSGEGRAEDIGESWAMARELGAKGVPNRVDSWGVEWPHDWTTWRNMFPKYLGEWTNG